MVSFLPFFRHFSSLVVGDEVNAAAKRKKFASEHDVPITKFGHLRLARVMRAATRRLPRVLFLLYILFLVCAFTDITSSSVEGPPNAKDTGISNPPPITEESLVPHGPIPLPAPNAFAEPANLKKEAKDDGDALLGGAGAGGEGSGVVKANKGMILRKSVEYIRYLQQLVTAQGARNRELEGELRKYRGDVGDPSEEEEKRVKAIQAHLPKGFGNGSLDGMSEYSDEIEDGEDDYSMGMNLIGEVGRGDVASQDVKPGSAKGSGKKVDGVNGSVNGTSTATARRKSLSMHKHSASTGRLPSMPEEDIESAEQQQQQQQQQLQHGHQQNAQHQQISLGSESGMDVDDGEERGRTRVKGPNGLNQQQPQQVQLAW